MTDLSVLIPSRNEEWLARTIADLTEHMRGDTEVIAVLDGAWANPPLPQHPRVQVLYLPQAVGQRAATNLAARMSSAKYLMKVDAHCAFAEGFDLTLMERMEPDWTVVPVMRNLHVFDWVCTACQHRRYQGPTAPCEKCGSQMAREVVWFPKPSPQSKAYCFDSTPHFQYFREYSKRPEAQSDLTESMSLQGSCFMIARDRYWALNICDESFGSWGSQGIEVACKSWLSGGRVLVNHRTWYAHMFRTQGGDFSFPYPISNAQQEAAKKHARDLFFNNRWEKQVRPLSWLVEKFWPVPGWTDDDLRQLKDHEKTHPLLQLSLAPASH